MTHDPTNIALAVACFAAAALVLVGLVWWLRAWFDEWLDRRLLVDFGADDSGPIAEWEQELLDQFDEYHHLPIHDAAVRAIRERGAMVAEGWTP